MIYWCVARKLLYSFDPMATYKSWKELIEAQDLYSPKNATVLDLLAVHFQGVMLITPDGVQLHYL